MTIKCTCFILSVFCSSYSSFYYCFLAFLYSYMTRYKKLFISFIFGKIFLVEENAFYFRKGVMSFYEECLLHICWSDMLLSAFIYGVD